jgi:hypothetical protein
MSVLSLVPQNFLLDRIINDPSTTLKIGGIVYPRATVIAQLTLDGPLNVTVKGASNAGYSPDYINNISQVT